MIRPLSMVVVVLFILGAALGCSDLVPDGADGGGGTGGDAADDGDAADGLPDIGGQSCESDEDCAHLAQCCLDVACDGGVCMPRYVSRCCTVPGNCPVSTALRKGECEAVCEPKGCVESLRLGDDHCDETLWEVALDAEGFAELSVDDSADDRVTWHLSRLRTFDGGPTLRAGDVLCPTYHTGVTAGGCEVPATDGGGVDLSLSTPPMTLPSDVGTLVELWLWADLPESDGLSTPLDGLLLDLIPEGTSGLTIWSTRMTPVPLRAWTPVLVDLSLWASQHVTLRLRFETLDGRDNDYEGTAIGRLRVRTACASDRTATDRSACEVAYTTEVRGLRDELVVFGPPDPTRACEACADASSCTRVDTCDSASCRQGLCEIERVITAECCTADARWPGDGSFEGPLALSEVEGNGDPEAWMVGDGWAVSELRSAAGERALHFGLPDGTGLAPPGMSAEGTVLSPLVLIPEDAPRWRFSLWLATEWDAAPSTANPAGVDLLEAVVLPDAPMPLEPLAVWDSREIGGTTLGSWVDVGVDLSAWRGQSVRLGWRFRTGDADQNEAEGVYIDRATVYRTCPGCDPGAVVPERPECAPF